MGIHSPYSTSGCVGRSPEWSRADLQLECKMKFMDILQPQFGPNIARNDLLTDWQNVSPSRHGPSSLRLFAPLPVPPKKLEHNNAEAARLMAAAAEQEEAAGVDDRSSPTCRERKDAAGGTVAVGRSPPPPADRSSRGPAAGGRWGTRRPAGSGASRPPATGGKSAGAVGEWAWSRATAARWRQPPSLSTWSGGRFPDG